VVTIAGTLLMLLLAMGFAGGVAAALAWIYLLDTGWLELGIGLIRGTHAIQIVRRQRAPVAQQRRSLPASRTSPPQGIPRDGRWAPLDISRPPPPPPPLPPSLRRRTIREDRDPTIAAFPAHLRRDPPTGPVGEMRSTRGDTMLADPYRRSSGSGRR